MADAALGNSADSSGTDGHSSLLEALADTATFNWALECVLSRAFQLPPDNAVALVFEEGDDAPVRAPELEPPAPQTERMALLPVIDSVNHYSRVPTYMHWEADGAISVSGETHTVSHISASLGWRVRYTAVGDATSEKQHARPAFLRFCFLSLSLWL